MARQDRLKSLRLTKTLFLEALESKTLMTAGLQRGVLNVTGTRNDDTIEIRLAPTSSKLIQVVENGKVTVTKDLLKVRKIQVNGGAGNDDIRISQANGKITLPVWFTGGKGNDQFLGGEGVNHIDGGSGLNAYKTSKGQDLVTNARRVDQVVQFGSSSAFRDFLINSSKNRSRFGGLLQRVGDVSNIAMPQAAPSSGTANKIAAPGYSQTNTQVAGVDEGDIIENDGRFLYILSRNELLIVDVQNPDAPVVASRTSVAGYPQAEYLYQGRLTVISTVWNSVTADSPSGIMPALRIRGSSQVEVTVYDVTDASGPKVVSQTKFDGHLSDSRMVDGKLALLLQNDLMASYWGGITSMYSGIAVKMMPVRYVSDADLAKYIQQTPVEKLLPTWSSTSVDAKGAKVTTSGLVSKPEDLYCPVVGNEANLMSVVMFDTTSAAPAIAGSASIIGGYASTIFMNSKDLYVFSPRWDSESGDSANIQRFDITGASPTLVSTGMVQGHLLNQFSADASGDLLRVATTSWTGSGRENAIYVLGSKGDTLKVTGALTGIAPGESITSARFMGDTAYLVTFRQTDPLFTIDLSNPAAPKIVGELVIPGYSGYLQPLGEGYLIGVGRDADPATGRTRGLKVSLFDVRDAANPKQVHSYVVSQPSESWTWSQAEWDHHALGFFPELNAIALPIQGYVAGPVDSNGYTTYMQQADLLLLQVDTVKGISLLGTVEQDSSLLRSARIGDIVYSVADLDMKAVEVLTDGITPRGSVQLQKPYDYGTGGGGGVIAF